MKIIYSSCNGSFDVDKKIEDSILFEKKDIIEKCIGLGDGEVIEEEKRLLKKFPDAAFR